MITNNILAKAKQYLFHTMGSAAVCNAAEPKLWSMANQLPFFLQNTYLYYEFDLFGHPCLLMLSNTQEGGTPAIVRKHWLAVIKHFKGDVIYLVEMINSYNRKRLIEHRVPFLIPGNQLYIPMLGIDLREYFKSPRLTKKSGLSGAAQAVVIREILHHDCSGLPAKELAKNLGYSPMTITRVINELTESELAEPKKHGREKHLSFPLSGRELWEAAKPLLQSPVKKRISVVWSDKNIHETPLDVRISGESALANYTALAGMNTHQWAIVSESWSAIAKQYNVNVIESKLSDELVSHREDKCAIELELWRYSPNIIALNSSCVDPLSLWLSVEKIKDERVEIARETLLEQVWMSPK